MTNSCQPVTGSAPWSTVLELHSAIKYLAEESLQPNSIFMWHMLSLQDEFIDYFFSEASFNITTLKLLITSSSNLVNSACEKNNKTWKSIN